MLITLTNINSEMKSMAVYSALFAMVIHWTAGINEFSFSTAIYGFENQLNAGKSGRKTIIYLINMNSRRYRIGPGPGLRWPNSEYFFFFYWLSSILIFLEPGWRRWGKRFRAVLLGASPRNLAGIYETWLLVGSIDNNIILISVCFDDIEFTVTQLEICLRVLQNTYKKI